MSLFTIAMSLPSAANMREAWQARHKRVKGQRSAVLLSMPTHRIARERGWLVLGRVIVTLTRVSSHPLDSDNLSGAFKGVRDQVAAQLGVDDRDKRLGWVYLQESGEAAVRIELRCVEVNEVVQVAV